MSPSLLLTPCTGHSVCLPLPRHCTASCPLKWDGALHWVMQLHSPGLWLVTWPQYWALIGWWRRQQGKEGPGRVEEGEACYLFTWTKHQTSLLATRDTDIWYYHRRKTEEYLYISQRVSSRTEEVMLVWMCIWWFYFEIFFYRISLILLLSSGSVTCLPSVNNVQVLFPPLCCYTLL